MMTGTLDRFVEDARGVDIKTAAQRLNLKFLHGAREHPQPCPACGGDDAFAFNTSKNKWNCRKGGIGGQDAIGMVAHVLGLDVRTREGLIEACEAALGCPAPDGGERESDEDRAARLAKLEAQRRRNAEASAEREREANAFREREREKARGIVDKAVPLLDMPVPAGSSGCEGDVYLRERGCGAVRDRWLRFSAEATYWHGQDERGAPLPLHVGPALIAPFVRFGPALEVEIVGCHITWIDLAEPPKFRPLLRDPATGERLATKKMRGTKKGGIIPLVGSPSARRWLGAEGIENTLAFGRWEGFRADTFYFAAGDLGNMAGPADPKSRFAHPTLTKPDRNGRVRPVMIAGPVPLVRDDGEPGAMVIPDHVDELVLLGDGDSEPVMTAATMVRARARHARPGRLIPVVWSRRGTDFAAMLADSPEAYEDID